jgi:hypothetical protein
VKPNKIHILNNNNYIPMMFSQFDKNTTNMLEGNLKAIEIGLGFVTFL